MTAQSQEKKFRDIFILLSAFILYLAILLPEATQYLYHRDDFRHFEKTQDMLSHPLAAWAPDKDHRRHPFFFYVLFIESRLFGDLPVAYLLILYTIHFLSSLAVYHLSKHFTGNSQASLASAVLFLSSSSFYQAVLFINTTPRVMSLFFFLLAVLSWIQYLSRPRLRTFLLVLLFQTVALLSEEDAMTLPLLALFLAWARRIQNQEKAPLPWGPISALLLAAAAVCTLVVEPFFRISPPTYRATWVSVSGASLFLPRFVSLFKMLLQPLLVPEKGYLPLNPLLENFARLAPALIVLTWLLGFLRPERNWQDLRSGISRHVIRISTGWILITALPYWAHSLTFEHVTRYMYFPMAGFSFFSGLTACRLWELSALRPFLKTRAFLAAVFLYILLLNMTTTAYHANRYRLASIDDVSGKYPSRVRALLGRNN